MGSKKVITLVEKLPYFTIESLKSIEKDKKYGQKWDQVLIFDGGYFEQLVLTEEKVRP